LRQHSGFTLLEVMIAVAILGVSLAAISGAISTAVRSVSLSSRYEQARQVAESRLALFLAQKPVVAGNYSGEDGNIAWEIGALPNPEINGLMNITVEVSFFAAGGRRNYTLRTREAVRELPDG